MTCGDNPSVLKRARLLTQWRPNLDHSYWPDQTLQWRNNERDGASNHRPHACLLNRLFRRRWKKHQSSASLAFVWGIHCWPVNSTHKGPVTRKMFSFDDVIMIWKVQDNLYNNTLKISSPGTKFGAVWIKLRVFSVKTCLSNCHMPNGWYFVEASMWYVDMEALAWAWKLPW